MALPGVLSAGSRRPLPKHHLVKIGVEVELALFRLTNQRGTTSVERKKDSPLKVRPLRPGTFSLNEPHQEAPLLILFRMWNDVNCASMRFDRIA